jgi:2-polyprenyl-3-methyl-5-hydroxy-6-metoxy-1,4-benzoquinol methylase
VSADPARRALALYAGASRSDRLHVWGRLRSCPFAAVEAHVPRAGRILDVGCGHGLFSAYLALAAPERHVLGVDIDEHKIEVARAAAASLDPEVAHLAFEVVGQALPAGSFDAITIVDVLYLLGTDRSLELLDQAAATLAPGGSLLVKEIDRRPAWKYRLSRTQEIVATRVLRITAGDEVSFAPPEVYADRLRRAGLTVAAHRLDRGSIHPHHLLVARRPT